MKVSCISAFICAQTAFAAVVSKGTPFDKRQLGGALSALLSGDTGILGALGSRYLVN
jgi:hypothetical protein